MQFCVQPKDEEWKRILDIEFLWSWEFAQIPREVCKTKCLDSAVCTRVAMEHTHKTFGGINLGPINPSTIECWVQKSKNYKWQHMINNSCKTSGIHFQKYIFKTSTKSINIDHVHWFFLPTSCLLPTTYGGWGGFSTGFPHPDWDLLK